MNYNKPPWKSIKKFVGKYMCHCQIYNNDGHTICNVFNQEDAKLIAAAPELYKSLHDLASRLEIMDDEFYRDELRYAQVLLMRLEETNETEKPDTSTMENGTANADHQP